MDRVKIIESFERDRPICVMAQLALDRLLSREALDQLFEKSAIDQYHRDLLFSSLARLMASVVLCRQKSVRAAYKRMEEDMGASLSAVYTKLERMETGLAQAVVRYSYAQVTAVSNELHAYDQSFVPGYRPKILDGNHLAGTQRRLRETRNSTAAPLPGKCLVVLDPRREAIADLFPIEDGHAQERSGLDEVIETIERRDLWIADRNFCTLKFLYAIAGRGAAFVIRKHQQLEGRLIGTRRVIGETDTGRVYEQMLELPRHNGKTLVIRQIEIELRNETRDGDRRIVLLTNLREEEADAIKVAQIYRKRWTLETAFQKLTVTLRCEVDTLCYPKAALFAFSLACLAYNAVAILLTTIVAEHGRPKAAEMSFHYMSEEIAQTHDGMMVAVPASYWAKVRNFSTADFAQHMRVISRNINFKYFRKSISRPRKRKPKLKHQSRKVHVSTAQILAKRKR